MKKIFCLILAIAVILTVFCGCQAEKNDTFNKKKEKEFKMEAYLFVHFVGTEGTAESEQIYFSVSKDGQSWETLNSGKPVLTSVLGEKGVRDPHIIRSPKGDKFYIVATDLSIYNRRDDPNRWGTCQTSGSRAIMIWESDDLVNWSDQRMVEVAHPNAGCTWAPESVYDTEKGEYMVFWASKVSDDNYSTQRIYRSYTKDFKKFSDPEVYIDDGNISNIDTTFIVDNGVYYRFTKNESKSSVTMMKSKSLNGEFTEVETYTLDGTPGNTITGYEGPTAYKLNGEDKWCLLLDHYVWGAGYKPFVTDDIGKGEFASAGDFNFDTTYRHGTVLPITMDEYNALVAKYSEDEDFFEVSSRPVESKDNEKLLFAMNFDNQDMTTISGKAELVGHITYQQSGDGYAAKFNGSGNNYIAITNSDGSSIFKDKDEITITMRKKSNSATSWWLYASPNNDAQAYQFEHYLGILDNGSKLTVERYNNNGARNESAYYDYSQGAWQDVTVVISKNRTTVYIDGKAVSEQSYNFALSDMLGSSPVAYIGRANWGGGEWASGLLDDIAIFDFAPDIDLGDTSNVKSDLVLPTASEEKDGYSISWKSLDESVVTSDGKITPPDHNKATATLTAEITFGDHKLIKEFDIMIRADDYYDYDLQITNTKGVDIQKGMYGLFFEDINYAADGGLYAEMIENRSFEALKSLGNGATTYDGGYGWSAYPKSGSGASLNLKSDGGLNENNPHYLEFIASDTQKSFKNQAYDGVYMESGKKYNVSLYAKKGTYQGSVKAQVYSNGKLAAEAVLCENLSDGWTKYEAVIVPEKTVRYADFLISLDGEGSAYFDMVSCIPEDAVMGIFRRDLAEKLKAINPGFLRFPGGCIIEGFNLDNRYNWKDTLGDVSERKQNWNRWSEHLSNGKDNGYKHYNQTYGIGYYEYFLLCEYLDCAAVPVVNVGMACEFQSCQTVPVFKNDGVTYTDEFYSYIQDALDLIEFANGDENTVWGKIRCEMGHKEPFNLGFLGVGNEQWEKDGNKWYERYESFESEIHKVYPEMKLISTSGPSAGGNEFDSAWRWIRKNAKKNDSFTYAVDEHYYMNPAWFLENSQRYDSYDRSVKVFAGEYAAHTALTGEIEKKNNLESAIVEAAFMIGLERNADVVYMASYAPLFARLGYTQWSPDMIWFDDAESYVSPTYYVQSMYSNNTGDYTLKSSVSQNTETAYQSVSYDLDTGDIIIKIANPYEHILKVKLSFDAGFKLTGKADIELLTGDDKSAVNSIKNPDNVKSKTLEADIINGENCELPPLSFVVIRVHTAG